ncbi:MAG: hypothetical protein RBR05_07085, partial [Candidatus Methanomethylophilaceae archaeon]|nr:hypothetical protein [Candidatus Methanomethylophilaceae archaeon]
WDSVSGLGASAWESVKSFATDAWTSISTKVTEIFGRIWDILPESLSAPLKEIYDSFSGLWNGFRSNATEVLGTIRNILADTFSEPLNNIRDSLGGLWDGFRTGATEAISGLAELVETVFTKVIDAILAPVKWVIEKLESLLDIDMPSISDILPSGDGSVISNVVGTGGGVLDSIKKGLGGLKFWADGGVAEPNNPFLAVLGDNRSEREVVTPVSLMRATMREVMMEMGTEGNNRPINLDVNLDGRRIARATYDYMEMERRRRGA